MRILHFSDTHLEFNDLEIVNDSGINQRESYRQIFLISHEMEIKEMFERVVEL
ncbi:MAG: hypothetical protein M0P91_02800 [Sulfuricurvum sp.]|uniref:hypothetical protein n=1 Tax=Sulfuricurvum sp. TaxID=2025608 RepID=UPI0025CB7880|nr:hypothetical protein [Sulfuricurvum sp.]MCK9372101.1 hypothetical protein [Sulfuricurvum sp.]